MRTSITARRKKSLKKLIICVLLALFVFVLVFLKIDKDIKPVLYSVSSSEIKILATESINRVVKEELTNNVKYSDLVDIKADSEGNITSIEMNTVEMNKLGADVALKVQDEMKFLGGRGVNIPLGVLTGSTILSSLGPNINVKTVPLGNVVTDFKSELQSAGINQSRYRVYITVNTELKVLIPFSDEKVNVASTIPIAETLIVGKVPYYYFNTQSEGTNMPNVFPVPSTDTD